ncbi:MAG: hypothetical protein COB53_06315 [Elusimicrobia bacterium]|nr:MAG: hypothetical protein COB53_06315 [Elusimicrobiota bacterium]
MSSAGLHLVGRVCIAALFFMAGVSHFTMTSKYVEMLPKGWKYVPGLIYVTGVLEILGAIGILVPHTTLLTGNCLIAFLMCVLPANIYASYARVELGGGELGLKALLFRVPLQFLLIAWIYRVTGQTWIRF